jgi:hypothetical protein
MKRFTTWFMDEGWAATAVVAWFVFIAILASKIVN